MARTPTPAAAAATPTVAAAATTDTVAADTAPATPPAAEPDSAETSLDDGERVEVRVLLAFGEHEPNHLALVLASELAGLIEAGHVDDHEDAVAYAKSLIA